MLILLLSLLVRIEPATSGDWYPLRGEFWEIINLMFFYLEFLLLYDFPFFTFTHIPIF